MSLRELLNDFDIDSEAEKCAERDKALHVHWRKLVHEWVEKSQWFRSDEKLKKHVLAILEALETPRNPGWHFYNKRERAKLVRAVDVFRNGSIAVYHLPLQSPTEGRTIILEEDFKRDIAISCSFNDGLSSRWKTLIDTLAKDKSRLRKDKEWYRIQAVLEFASKHLANDSRNRETTCEDAGLTPTWVLQRLGIDVSHSLGHSDHRPSSVFSLAHSRRLPLRNSVVYGRI
ncbi:hypothetical protein JCM16303_003105 [Sporobolomyces ruberrimus]